MNEQKSKKQNGTKRKQKSRDKGQSKSAKKVKDKKNELKKSSKKETGAQNRAKSEVKKSKKEETKDTKLPKRSWPAFFFFQKEKRLEIKKNNPDLSQKDLVSKLGEVWRGLSEEQKKPYFDQERKDKARYMKEKEEYSKVSKNLPGNKTKGKKSKSKTVKLGPKRAWPPFFFYQEQRREDLKKENPNLNHKEIVSKLGEEWRTLTEKEKQPFVDKSSLDQKRYEVEKKEYQSSLPEEDKEDILKKKGKSSLKNSAEKSKEQAAEKKPKKAKKQTRAKSVTVPKKNVKQPKPPVRPAGGRHSKRIKRIEEEQYIADVHEYKEHKGLNEEETKKLLISTLQKDKISEEEEDKPAKVEKPAKAEKKAAPKAKAAAKGKKGTGKEAKHEDHKHEEKEKQKDTEGKDEEMEPQEEVKPNADEAEPLELEKAEEQEDAEMAPEDAEQDQKEDQADEDEQMEPEKENQEPERDDEEEEEKESEKKSEKAEAEPEEEPKPETAAVVKDTEIEPETEKNEVHVDHLKEDAEDAKHAKSHLLTPQKHKTPSKADGKVSPHHSPRGSPAKSPYLNKEKAEEVPDEAPEVAEEAKAVENTDAPVVNQTEEKAAEVPVANVDHPNKD